MQEIPSFVPNAELSPEERQRRKEAKKAAKGRKRLVREAIRCNNVMEQEAAMCKKGKHGAPCPQPEEKADHGGPKDVVGLAVLRDASIFMNEMLADPGYADNRSTAIRDGDAMLAAMAAGMQI